MGRPRTFSSDRERHAHHNGERAVRNRENVEFIAVDGEGTGRGRDHKYVLLTVGDQHIINENGLRITEIFAFLWEQYLLHPDAVFVGFFLGYDFTQWFKTLPEGRGRILLTTEGINTRKRKKAGTERLGPFPVEYMGWQFDILGMKRLKLRPKGAKSWMYINDTGSFFQTSFLNVINPKNWPDGPVCTQEEYDVISNGKAKRDTAKLDENMVQYNAMENVILGRVCHRLHTGLIKAGVRLNKRQWFGPGQAAQEWLNHQDNVLGSTEIPDTIPSWFLDAARKSYYGGWFEIFAHGHIPGISYEYDINSAYPFAMASLPCLRHGKWSHGIGDIPGDMGRNAIVLVHATVRGHDRKMGSMLHRVPSGDIRRPHATRGYYWYSEIEAGIRCGIISEIQVSEWYAYEPCLCKPPLRGLAGLYDERKRAGKNTPFGKALKLIYNSAYGKFAQSIGDPRYGNAVYASLITSKCREMILDAIATHPAGVSGVLMVATDGVYFRSRHYAIAISSNLGDWEEATHSNLTLFKPGVYWDDRARQQIAAGENPSFKARGINAAEFAKQITNIDSHFSRWGNTFPGERDPNSDREGWYPEIRFESGFSMVTCQQALQRGKWFLAGSVNTARLIQDADPITKRHSGYYEDGIYWSRPYADGGPEFESTPYDKSFGQPDIEEYGITDDGPVMQSWREVFKP